MNYWGLLQESMDGTLWPLSEGTQLNQSYCYSNYYSTGLIFYLQVTCLLLMGLKFPILETFLNLNTR
jgi:hypothetical protein